MTETALIVFLKFPEKGKVKTRLSRDLNKDFVFELYKAFVSDLVEKLRSVRNTFFFVWPLMEKTDEEKKVLENLIGREVYFYCQQGDHLGDRMANAFNTVFDQGCEQAVLIGTDIPEINADLIFNAFDMLEKNAAVIGPATDGGYYLIGFRKSGFSKSVFDGIEWSTQQVLSRTIAGMNQQGITCGFLPKLDDIDTLEDLKALALRCKNGGSIGWHTRKLLEQL
ncbi:MAG: TIGR04282 family arsenosugar biosynthesis glycosyltransferase [Proteobacteria bacterium]|nr:TIGR04282 family arsenosugar biosynthesis glycosyltransferase [Pseudomonadota bacterium]MBU1389339.1 TIGR04282 family arsenosugar biosynthesis glycosyltransferase [Pseudomonadota bacterium]MBU1544159.1 TIGR04282 family arsenosugar biosynthesis glycosyltransferase [Pseudomonadota bacterium]MBU2480166.1 TIGR04282 family arsenosugar biosynthesis glycosyltransferase [Pseudomonadota bacterium]